MASVKAVVFDFGGVFAEEGFREGLLEIGRRNKLDPEQFRKTADDFIHASGYVTGQSDESRYWKMLRQITGIRENDTELKEEILKRFTLRPEMIEIVEKLKREGLITAILSDQTNWLEEIDRRTPFFHYFPYIFNSYRLGKSKRDPSLFADVCAAMGIDPEDALFIDDNIENTRRAQDVGLSVIWFRTMDSFRDELKQSIERSRSC